MLCRFLHCHGTHDRIAAGYYYARLHPLNFGIAQLLLTIPVAVGYRFYTVGFSRLFRRAPNMDSLIAIGTGAAFLYGIYAIYRIIGGDTEYAMDLYFETAGVIISLILLGRYLKLYQRARPQKLLKADGAFAKDGSGYT